MNQCQSVRNQSDLCLRLRNANLCMNQLNHRIERVHTIKILGYQSCHPTFNQPIRGCRDVQCPIIAVPSSPAPAPSRAPSTQYHQISMIFSRYET